MDEIESVLIHTRRSARLIEPLAMKEQVNTQNVFLLEMNGRIEEQKLEVQRRSDKTDGLSFKWLRPQCEPIQRP